jgi:hypothetical protein
MKTNREGMWMIRRKPRNDLGKRHNKRYLLLKTSVLLLAELKMWNDLVNEFNSSMA